MAGRFIEIRDYRPEDEEALIALWARCKLTTWFNDPQEDIALITRTESARILLAERKGQILGSNVVCHDGHRGWYYYLGVDPDLREGGLGRRLVSAGEDWLRSQGVPKVQLMVRPTNQGVHAFYERLGYEYCDRAIFSKWLKEMETPKGQNRPEGLAPLPEPTLDITITYLEMTERPSAPNLHLPSNIKAALIHAKEPTLSFYRYLYNTVGEPWLWYEKRMMPDEDLKAIIHDPKVEVFVLYLEGVPAGYFELDLREAPEVDLAYFGLVPDFIGLKLGPWLLSTAIQMAWDKGAERLTVNTCTLDHPKALPLYQRMGFKPYRQEAKTIRNPRLFMDRL